MEKCNELGGEDEAKSKITCNSEGVRAEHFTMVASEGGKLQERVECPRSQETEEITSLMYSG